MGRDFLRFSSGRLLMFLSMNNFQTSNGAAGAASMAIMFRSIRKLPAYDRLSRVCRIGLRSTMKPPA